MLGSGTKASITKRPSGSRCSATALKAAQLRFLFEQREKRVEDHVHEAKVTGNWNIGKVGDHDRHFGSTRLGSQLRHHRFRRVDTCDAHPAPGERDSDSTGADAELERRPVRSQLSQKVNRRLGCLLDRRRDPGVVHRRDAVAVGGRLECHAPRDTMTG